MTTAIELADWADDLFSSDGQPKEVAEMLRKQHEAIVKLREALANHFYSPSYDTSQAVKQVLKDTKEFQ